MLPIVLALALTSQSSEIAAYKKGSWLYAACKGSIRWLEAPQGSKPEDDNSNFDNCTSYVAGVAEGDTHSCPPDEASLGTMVRLYILYMDKNPKLLDTYRIVGISRALRQSYPCPAK